MGRRKGETGAGRAGVSSLSTKSGGRVLSKTQKKDDSNNKNDNNNKNGKGQVVSAGWVGKTPVVFLREWCLRNDRKRPV